MVGVHVAGELSELLQRWQSAPNASDVKIGGTHFVDGVVIIRRALLKLRRCHADHITLVNMTNIVHRFGGIENDLGSVKMNALKIFFGTDLSGRLIQLPVTFREDEISREATLVEQHGQFVSSAMHDSEAVTALIRFILNGDHSDHDEWVLDGSSSRVAGEKVEAAQIAEATRQRSIGTITVGDQVRTFLLRMPNLPKRKRPSSTDYDTARLNLRAQYREDEPVIIAELVLDDALW